jgi:hypothetical protein
MQAPNLCYTHLVSTINACLLPIAYRDNRTVNDAWIYKAGVPQATVTTSNGCQCKQPWMNDGQSFYNCWNPDGDANNWCYVQVLCV